MVHGSCFAYDIFIPRVTRYTFRVTRPMVKGFWQKLKTPIIAQAPMANVTDAAFRRMIAKYGKPDVMWTEFVSCDGLCSERGREALLRDFWFDPSERPIVAQIFGATPDHFYTCAQLIQELGFDGIDINMGCPDKSVEKQGAGAALIKNPKLAQEIIQETMRGAGPLPVSIKTRIGYQKNTIDEWMKYLLDMSPAAITIHGRTRKEMSKVPAHWDVIAHAAELAHAFDSSKTRTLILGNGDVKDVVEAKEKAAQYNLDGVMIGRGMFGNPWLFLNVSAKRAITQKSPSEAFLSATALATAEAKEGNVPSTQEKLNVMTEHTILFEKLFGENKRFDVMKKHYKAYVNGFDGAKELRIKLMNAKNAQEVIEIVEKEYPVLRRAKS